MVERLALSRTLVERYRAKFSINIIMIKMVSS